MSAAFAFILRIHHGPINLEFIKPQIEAALSNPQQDVKVSIGKLSLTWPTITKPLLLDLDGVQVNQENTQNLSIENTAFSLSGLGLLTGKILPTYVLIEHPVLHLVQQDGRLGFLWQKPEANKPEPNEIKAETLTPKKLQNDVRDFLSKLTDKKRTDSVFSHLEEIELKQAIIKAEAFQKNTEDYLAIIDLKLKKNNTGLQGVLSATLPGEEGNAASLKSDIMYRLKEKDITFTADLESFNPAHLAPFFNSNIILTQQDFTIGGKVQAAFDEKLSLQTALMNFTIPQGTAHFPQTYDTPLAFKDVIFEAHLNRPENSLNVEKFEATVNDVTIKATAKGNINNHGIRAPLTLEIPNLPLEKISSIFPKPQLNSTAGKWLTQRLKNGRAYDVILKTDLSSQKNTETGERNTTVKNTRLDFKTEGVTVKYSDTLKPVTDAKTVGFYENDTLEIKGSYGKIDDIISTDINVKITDLTVKGGGKAHIAVKAKGPIKTALEYISDKPIAIGNKLNFDIKDTKGIIDYDLDLSFPTVKNLPKEQVKVTLDSTVTNLTLPKIIRGLDLTGGPYNLGFKDGAITLKGKGKLGTHPIELDFFQYLNSTGKKFESKITASLISDQKLRNTFGIGLEDYISGALPIDFVYTDYGEKAIIDIKGDLTPTAIHIDPFDYIKKGGVGGDLSLQATLKNADIKTINNLSLKTKGLSLPNGNLSFRKLSDGSTDVSGGTFTNAVLGKTNANVNFEVTPDNIIKAVVDSPVLDITPFLKSNEKDKKTQEKDGKPLKLSASAQKIICKNGENFSEGKIYFEMNKDNEINHLEMDSKVGEGIMYIRFKPETGTEKRTFRMESTDAGKTLKALGLHDKVRGGTIKIYGVPQGRDLSGDLFGSARIDDFRVKSTPVLAKLLGAMSLSGVNDLLGNDGVSFARLEAEFEWQFRDAGNFLVIKEGRTSGSSLGLTFDGSIDQLENQINLNGTIVPISGVNKVIGSIPLIGDILTGGDALIAATYNVSGTTSDPKVSVNPLSVLAPGFLRKILFEGGTVKPPTTQE